MPAHHDDDGEEDDRSRAQALIDWLADKNPDVWFAVTPHLNWDNAMPVLDWIVSQPQCDRANAAAIFWGCDPLYYIGAHGTHAASTQDGLGLLERVLRNWKMGFYRRAELAWEEDWRGRYRRAVAIRPGHRDPFAIPRELLGPIRGRAPEVAVELTGEGNAELRQLLLDLGTHVGASASSKWRARPFTWAERMRSALGLN